MLQGTTHRFVLVVDNRPAAEQILEPNPDPSLPDIAVAYRDSATCAFEKESTIFPLLRASNPDKLPPVSGLVYKMAVSPEFPECAEPQALRYKWHLELVDRRPIVERHAAVVAGDTRSRSIVTSAASPSVSFPPGSIWGNRLYNLTAVSWFESSPWNRDSVTELFTPRLRPLIAIIWGGAAQGGSVEDRTIVSDSINTLDGRQSNDPDAPADPRPLVYRWSCRDHQNDDRPCTFVEGAEDPTESSSARTAQLTIPAGVLLDRTRYEFVLRVTKQDSDFDRSARVAEDFTRLTVGRSATPLVTIEAPGAVNVHTATRIRARAFSNHPPMSYSWAVAETRSASGSAGGSLASLSVERPFITI